MARHLTAVRVQTDTRKKLEVEESLCDVPRLEVLTKYSFMCSYLPGEFWEMGVYKGGSAQILAHYATESKKKLRLFDSFEGIPEPTFFDKPVGGVTPFGESIMEKGEWSTSSDSIYRKIPDGCDCSIYKGWVPDTFAGLEDSTIALAHVDIDLYKGTKAALLFLYPRMTPGGIIAVDDFGYPRNPGIATAVHETLPVNYRIWCECENQAILRRGVDYIVSED